MNFNSHYTSKEYRGPFSGNSPGFKLDDFFESLFRVPEGFPGFQSSETSATRIAEGTVDHTVTIPGYGKDDVTVTIEDGEHLFVRTKPADGEKPRTLAQMPLVSGADYSKAKAVAKNGLLRVTAPYVSAPKETFVVEVADA